MKKNLIAMLLILLGVVIIFSDHKAAWWLSAVLIGVGSGLMFMRDIK
tara:strand:- start:204 stop:344 length:141 start_codon:yes stop_codon:yes gene_type:complete